jgi:hypothetical protein
MPKNDGGQASIPKPIDPPVIPYPVKPSPSLPQPTVQPQASSVASQRIYFEIL